jgi:glycosyltransferase involved in cell wall biosynthesis
MIDLHDKRRIYVAVFSPPVACETFIQAHIDRLPATVRVVQSNGPVLDGHSVRSMHFVARALRKANRMLTGQTYDSDVTAGYLAAFRRCRPDAVLAEYGGCALGIHEACRTAGIPLIAHFHGYDASLHSNLREMEKEPYQSMFRDAAAIIAVSIAMRRRLISLGVCPTKVYWNPYGVDCAQFDGADPANAPPVFLAVGRFTEKKAPQLTLKAFARVYKVRPDAQLRMIGFGPLEETCKNLARELGIADAVTFLGSCAPAVVQQQMKSARCFVQHSIEASNGDSEGTPVAILEAGATGLPVVSTLHAGIPDVVIDGETGFLVAEGDVAAMADRMLRLVLDAQLAATLGRQAHARIRTHFSMEKSIGGLWAIIEAAIQSNNAFSASHAR